MTSGGESLALLHPELAVLTADEMRRVERAAFARGLPSFEAMERAGNAVAEVVLQRWPVAEVGDVVVLCGPGNNGGDGFIAAAALRAAGYRVSVAAVAPAVARSPDAQRALAGWGEQVSPLNAADVAKLRSRDLVIDALFGIGLSRPLEGSVREVVEAVNRSEARIVAVDVPSGTDADTGAVLGASIRADITIAFGWAKRGHLLLPAAAHCGTLVVADVGFTAADLGAVEVRCLRNAPALWRGDYPLPQPEDHKYRRGHAVMVGGAVMTGAVRLAARAARRVGLGLLTLVVPRLAWNVYAQDEAGAIVRPADDPTAALRVAGDARVTALLVGSGLEPDRSTAELVTGCIALGRAMVIDGGGLTALAPQAGQGGLRDGRPNIVLTPHEGEFARLFPDLAGAGSKLERARTAAARSGCTVILKGADTVIAGPDGTAILCDLAPAALATAGSGDVLAGIVTGLLGLGLGPLAAAAMAAWLHGRAGAGTSPSGGLGLIAEDLPDLLPGALLAALAQKAENSGV